MALLSAYRTIEVTEREVAGRVETFGRKSPTFLRRQPKAPQGARNTSSGSLVTCYSQTAVRSVTVRLPRQEDPERYGAQLAPKQSKKTF